MTSSSARPRSQGCLPALCASSMAHATWPLSYHRYSFPVKDDLQGIECKTPSHEYYGLASWHDESASILRHVFGAPVNMSIVELEQPVAVKGIHLVNPVPGNNR